MSAFEVKEVPPEAEDLMKVLKQHTIIILLNRMGGNAAITIDELEEATGFNLLMGADQDGTLNFTTERKH